MHTEQILTRESESEMRELRQERLYVLLTTAAASAAIANLTH